MKENVLSSSISEGDMFMSAGDMFRVTLWTGRKIVIKINSRYYVRAEEIRCADPVEIDISKIDIYYRIVWQK